jgi:phosphoribosylglycinamide formyltransferase-1
MNIGVLASHEGTTLQSLLDACAGGRVQGRVAVVVSNNGDSGALRRARQAGVQAVHLSSKTHEDRPRWTPRFAAFWLRLTSTSCSWRVI